MGIDLIVAVTVACLFGIVAMLALARLDSMDQDLDYQMYWRAYWEREAMKQKSHAAKQTVALREALELLGELRDDS